MQYKPPMTPRPGNLPGAQQQPPPTLLSRITHIWIQISGPSAQGFSITIQDQERLRRSRLISALLPLIAISIFIALPVAIIRPVTWIPLGLIAFLGIMALFLNRTGYIAASGLLYILAIDLTLTALMIVQPHGIRNGNIPDFDLFILPVLIGGVVLPRNFLPFLAALNIIIIVTVFGLVPHDPLLTEEIALNQKGFAFAELTDAFILQISGAIIAWLSAWSVDKALSRASKAEELADARAMLAEQSQQIIEQKRRLEYGVNVIKETQALVANGDYNARVRLQDNELVPLAISFNLIVERLSRTSRIERDHALLVEALNQFLQARNSLARGEGFVPPHPTNTIVDHLHPLLEVQGYFTNLIEESSIVAEAIRNDLQRQRTYLAQSDAILTQVTSILQVLINRGASIPLQAQNSTAETQSSSLELAYLQSNGIKQIARLVNEGSEISKNTRETCNICLQNIKELDQRLRVTNY